MQSVLWFLKPKGKMKEKGGKTSWELTTLEKEGHPIRCWERFQKTNKEFFYKLNIIK